MGLRAITVQTHHGGICWSKYFCDTLIHIYTPLYPLSPSHFLWESTPALFFRSSARAKKILLSCSIPESASREAGVQSFSCKRTSYHCELLSTYMLWILTVEAKCNLERHTHVVCWDHDHTLRSQWESQISLVQYSASPATPSKFLASCEPGYSLQPASWDVVHESKISCEVSCTGFEGTWAASWGHLLSCVALNPSLGLLRYMHVHCIPTYW